MGEGSSLGVVPRPRCLASTSLPLAAGLRAPLVQVIMPLPGTPAVPHCFSLALSPFLTPRMPEVTLLSAPGYESPSGKAEDMEGPKAGCPHLVLWPRQKALWPESQETSFSTEGRHLGAPARCW